MKKITTLSGCVAWSKKQRSIGHSLGLIVGSFDVLHMGHLNLFRFAKKFVDNLVVALDSDETIKITKGKDRPINNSKLRADFLSDITTIDKIFIIEKPSLHGSEESINSYTELLMAIKPTHIFTHKICDRHWKAKASIAKKLGIIYKIDRSPRITNSGTIISQILQS